MGFLLFWSDSILVSGRHVTVGCSYRTISAAKCAWAQNSGMIKGRKTLGDTLRSCSQAPFENIYNGRRILQRGVFCSPLFLLLLLPTNTELWLVHWPSRKSIESFVQSRPSLGILGSIERQIGVLLAHFSLLFKLQASSYTY
jgi:hypothetical protein